MSVLDLAGRVAGAALPQAPIKYGPWAGSMRSIPADRVGREFLAGGSDFHYLPRSGYWRRRAGQSQKFDSFGSPVGMLPAKWTSRCRQIEEFTSESISDHVPTLIALLSRETIGSGLDDGRFSNVWLRDQLNSLNYTVGDEYGSTTYPSPGTEASYKFVPLWYDSGDGGVTRGVSEFARRFFFSGSRRMLKVGNWWYFPSILGTPSRWRGRFTPASQVTQTAVPNGSSGSWGLVGAPTFHEAVDEGPTHDGLTTYIQSGDTSPVDVRLLFTMTHPSVRSGYVIHAVVQRTSAGTYSNALQLRIFGNTTDSPGSEVDSNLTFVPAGTGSGFAEYTHSLTQGGMDALQASFSIILRNGIETSGKTYDVTSVWITAPGSMVESNRLAPSGPWPPTHAGTLARGNTTETNSSFVRPDADVTDGTWLGQDGGSSLFSYIDEVTIDDADYIKSAGGGTACTIGLGDFGFTPAADATVKLHVRARVASGSGTIIYELLQGAISKASGATVVFDFFGVLEIVLSPAEIASITDWTDLRVRLTPSLTVETRVSYVDLEHLPQTGLQTIGGWRGSDKFYRSVAYRFEDDAILMPCVPRGPNTTLPDGYNLFTVNPSNLTAGYEKLTWSNIPIGPFGTKSRILLRSPKIDSSTESTLELDPTDLRVVWEIKDNVTTTYDDFYADDDALTLDVDDLLVRDDHIMPPRARYVFGGDARICHSYGGLNPAAIILAPIGRAADYDLNLDDETASLWNQNSSYFRVAIDSAGLGTLTLNKSTGTVLTTKSLAFATYDTLEKLVDAINATSFAVDGLQWRAQICPGANPQAPCLSALTPNSRAIASCVISGSTITKAAGGLSKVPVGALISGTGVTIGAYVSRIDSDTQLTFVGTITPATVTLTFYTELGDAPTVATANDGYQRVIANSLPGFIYFTKTYLGQFPLEKSSVWMTVATPGAVKSAANCFSGKTSNKHTPPLEAGISMGGAAVDNGFVVPFSNKSAAIRNTRDVGTGIDSDYRLFILNESRGCCAWASVASGNRVAVFFSPEGVIGSDLFNEVLLSEAIFLHAPNPAGDFTYEAPLCIAATAMDDDTAYLSIRVLRGVIWINYRASGSHPNRQVAYDFSSGHQSNGIPALFRPAGGAWGWSLPLSRSMTMMTEGRRADGSHLYGWNEQNAGSTGDGRIDEFETGDTDNGAAISASALTPWERLGSRQLSAQEITVEHSSPTGATVFLDFHRSYPDETYVLTPSLSSTLIVSRDVKMLPLAARVSTAACYLGWRQTAGGASELRGLELRAKALPSYK